MFNCSYCTYISSRKFCVKQHEDNIHFMEKYNNTTTIQEQKIDIDPRQTYNCCKCNKEYLTLKFAKNHEDKCIGIDNLTCPKCMKSFSTRQHKSTHIKNNNCKARSIAYVREIKDDIYINNYGNERLDYIKADEMLKFIYEHSKSLHLFIEKKYFNKNFPENHNIKKVDEKCYKMKEDGVWKSYHISLLSFKLVEDNLKCLSFGKPSVYDFSYNPSILQDENDTVVALNKATIQWEGREFTFNGKKMILREETREVYDYDSYMHAIQVPGFTPILLGKLEKKDGKYRIIKTTI